MTRVRELVDILQETLTELVMIEENSNKEWRKLTEDLNVLDHEIEIIPLNGGQLGKVMSYRKKLRLERREHKNNWYCAKSFNDAFQSERILNSMATGQKHLRRQEKQGENLIQDRGMIASILQKPEAPEEAQPKLVLVDEVAVGKE